MNENLEDDLVDRARGGDVESINVLMARYRPRLLRKARSLMHGQRRSIDASDVVQSTLRRALGALPHLESNHEGALQTWFSTILERTVRDVLRRDLTLKRGEGVRPASLEDLPQELGGGVPVDEFGLDRDELALRAWSLMAPNERALVRQHLEGASWAEVAEAHGIPSPEAARKRVEALVARLRLRFSPHSLD
jgi:RNA polymerase sigma factor (sigma-70 family)